MKELLKLLERYRSWLVFSVYVCVAMAMLFSGNPYQQHVYNTSAGSVASGVYSMAENVTSYFHLRDVNDDLTRRNGQLQLEVLALKERLRRMDEHAMPSQRAYPTAPEQRFDLINAHVIKNSIARPYNYLTINRGSADGVRPEMGVIDATGIVGIVGNVAPHSARVISLLNPKFRLSCKIKGSDSFGSLVWEGSDPRKALLEELPRHTRYHAGDTIVTSGYSAVFPEGLPVAVVSKMQKRRNENFFTLNVDLLTDFSTLSLVQVISDNLRAEVQSLEEGEEEDNKTDTD